MCGAVARSLFALVALSAPSVLCVCAGTNPLGPGAEVMSSGEWQISKGTGYGLAGLGHLFGPNRNFKERTALVSDLAIFRLGRRLRCEPCRLESAHANYSVGTPELLSSGSISPVSQQCSMRMLLANDHSGCVKAQGRFLSMKQ